MRIATWNVNSIKVRLPLLLEWLKVDQPDVVLLQEIKCEEVNFPALEIQSAGYDVLVRGQKSYNGVAILSRSKANLRAEALPGDTADTHARYLEADIGGFVVASIYLPNGNPIPGEKFAYKLAWMERLYKHAQELLKEEKPVILGGDFNVIPEAMDAENPAAWKNDALFQPESRSAWRKIINTGYYDAFRLLHPTQKHAYTFWDYQAGAYDRDDGIRIDHLFLSPEAADRLRSTKIIRDLRGKPTPSDHVPMMGDFE
jgi:exodeoxyribonuclease-3